ncbi:MAG: c-type cytochrome [Bosea sp. (in: a-proteobacteria)]
MPASELNGNHRRRLASRGGAAALVALSWLSGSALAVAMPADAQRPENRESARIGEGVAKQYCSACHAIGKTGRSPNPKAPRFPLIAERYKDGNPASVLIDGTVVRHPGMPEFRLLENETDGLVAYIRRISRKWKPARAP